MIFPTPESHINGLLKLVGGNPQLVMVATYNVYAGILHDGDDSHEWGGKYENETHDFLDRLNKVPEVKILVGFPALKLCKENCEDCIKQQYKLAMRLDQHRKKWPNFEWRYSENFHLKCYLFYYKGGYIGIGGGRNLSSSDWTDVSFILDPRQVQGVREIFDNSWKNAKPITMANLEKTIDSQMD